MAKIAVVDDSSATVTMISSILQAAGHSVVSFTDSASAEAGLKKELPAFIFMDIVMPEKNGYEIIRALNREANTKNIPVVIVSSKGEETDIKWGKRQGAVDYVVKPFTPEQILAVLNKHLAVGA